MARKRGGLGFQKNPWTWLSSEFEVRVQGTRRYGGNIKEVELIGEGKGSITAGFTASWEGKLVLSESRRCADTECAGLLQLAAFE